MEVVHANGDNLEPTVRIFGQGSQSHDGDTGLEREKLGAVMTTTLWENANAATVSQAGEDGLIHLGLIDMRGQLVLGALVAGSGTLQLFVGEVSIFVDVVAARQLLHCKLALERTLDTDLFGTNDLSNIYTGTGDLFAGWQEQHSLDLTFTLAKSSANTADQGRIVNRVRKVDGAGGRLCGILSSSNGDGADLARAQSDEAMNGLLGDEKRGSTVGLVAKGTL